MCVCMVNKSDIFWCHHGQSWYIQSRWMCDVMIYHGSYNGPYGPWLNVDHDRSCGHWWTMGHDGLWIMVDHGSWCIVINTMTIMMLLLSCDHNCQWYTLACTDGVRLNGVASPTDGQVDVCVDGIYSSICATSSWGVEEASVACRQLGLPSG